MLVQRRSRALRPYPSRILWARVVRACHSLLASPEGSAAEPSRLLSATVTRPPPSVRKRSSRSRLPPSVFWRVLERAPPSSSRLKTATRQLHWCCGTAPPLRVSGKRDQKLHLRATCTYQGRRNLHERLGHEPGSGETADDARGDT